MNVELRRSPAIGVSCADASMKRKLLTRLLTVSLAGD
jgi:hypothetical protein